MVTKNFVKGHNVDILDRPKKSLEINIVLQIWGQLVSSVYVSWEGTLHLLIAFEKKIWKFAWEIFTVSLRCVRMWLKALSHCNPAKK